MHARTWRKSVEMRFVIPAMSVCASVVLRARRPFVIGITGTVGKTTTKEMVAGVLMHPAARAVVGRVGKSPGNLNNNLGVPMAVLGYTDWFSGVGQWLLQLAVLPFRTLALATVAPYPDVLVLELAAGWEGRVSRSCRLVRPTIGIVTEVGPAHLECFGTIEHLGSEKAALVRAIPPTGLVVLNRGNPLVAAMRKDSRAAITEVEGRGVELSRAIARVVARHLGVSDIDIETALRSLSPVSRRLQRMTLDAITIIDDAFNANPLSMKLALDVLAESASPGQRRVAILGTMRELGSQTVMYHEEIGTYARSRADLILGVGEHAEHYSDRHVFPDSDACATALRDLLRPGDIVLIKGSAAVQLVRVVKALKGLAFV
jgi:UDP-N-acetylmuramoyl-tripeptide--D-alanyl-D-alanine ligase